MPFERIPGTDERYALISFDKDGKERTGDPDGANKAFSARILADVAQQPPSHVFFFSHGWKGDIAEARDQYNRWIKAMVELPADRSAIPGPFKPLWIGLHWPSLPFGDEELGAGDFAIDAPAMTPDEIVATYLDRLGLGSEAERLLRTIVQAHQHDAAALELPADAASAYNELAALAGHKGDGPSSAPDADGQPFDANTAFEAGNAAALGTDFAGGGFIGGILGPLRQLSYWTMKKRARSIGESGMHAFVADLMNAAPNTRFHLMGHSFGCIVVSSILGGPSAGRSLPRAVDSVALIQGAVSLWAFADKIPGQQGKGYFNPFIHRSAIRGPLVVSRSIHDRAVGVLYPLASAVSLSDGSFDPDDDNPPLYGAIGKFGIRGLSTAVFQPMLVETKPYGFKAGTIYNLESSQFIAKGGGAAGAHSDIDGPQVAHALWQAASV